jgi:surface antigen
VAVLAMLAGGAWAASAPGYSGQNQYQNQNPRGGGRAQQQFNQGYEEGYDEGYAAGYRRGYDDARANRRFNDRVVRDTEPQADPRALWAARYQRLFTYNDDIFYRECRNQQADPGGVIANALIGGLLGQQAAQGRQASDPGVIVAGAGGANLLRDLNCEDRSYAYKAYYDALNGDGVNRSYEWRNVRTGRRGVFVVERFAEDPDGFRCAYFAQTIFYQGRTNVVRGRACQQPDQFWTVVG